MQNKIVKSNLEEIEKKILKPNDQINYRPFGITF